MTQSARPYAQWIIAFLIGVIVTLLWSGRGEIPTAAAQHRALLSTAPGVIPMTGQIAKDEFGLFLVNTDTNTINVYRYFAKRPQNERFQLVAARSFFYDRHLDDYNNASPTPEEVRILTENAKRIAAPKAKRDPLAEPPDDSDEN